MTGLTLTVDGKRHEGWKSARVTRSIETISGSFRLVVSERHPGDGGPDPIAPGSAATLALDGEVVITGQFDAVTIDYSALDHEITIKGRDATADLVDCSASTKPGEWKGEKLEAIAAAIAEPLGIGVTAAEETGKPFRVFRIEPGESAFEAIERGCRMRGLLPLSDGRGGVEIGRALRSRAAVQLVRGVNIISAQGVSDWTDRFSEYTVIGQQPPEDKDQDGSSMVFGAEDAPATMHVASVARDEDVSRHRPLRILAEQSIGIAEAAERVRWEASVRKGRSIRISVTVQGWREGTGGPLWAPGRLVGITDEWLGLDRELLISSVTQSISGGGSVSVLTLRPQDAFLPEIEKAKPTKGKPAERNIWK